MEFAKLLNYDLNLRLNTDNLISKEMLNVRYGEEVNGEFKGISYYHIPKKLEKKILNIFKLKGDFEVQLMVITNDEIPPHIDSNATVSINYYIKTCGNTVTSFYESNNESTIIKINNQTDGYILI